MSDHLHENGPSAATLAARFKPNKTGITEYTVHGEFPEYMVISLTKLASLHGNRRTDSNVVVKRLNTEKGLNLALLGFIQVARFMHNGKLIYRVFNGDHRMAAARLAGLTELPCLVYDVASAAEATSLLERTECSAKKGMNGEVRFVTSVFSEYEDALKLADDLKYCGLSVSYDDAHGTVAATTVPKVNPSPYHTKIRLFEQAIQLKISDKAKEMVGMPEEGLDFTKCAVDTITRIWPGDANGSKQDQSNFNVRPETLMAFAFLFSMVPMLAVGKNNDTLVEMIRGFPNYEKQAKIVEAWHTLGGKGGDVKIKKAKEHQYIALTIARHVKDSKLFNSTVPNAVVIKDFLARF